MNLKALPGFKLIFLTVCSFASVIMVAPTLYAEKQAYKLTTLAEGLDFLGVLIFFQMAKS